MLGAILLDNSRWAQVAHIVNSSDFHLPRHRVLFGMLRDLVERGQPLDGLTVTDEIKRTKFEHHLPAAYVAEICEGTPAAANAVAYAEIVARKSRERAVIRIAHELAERASDGTDAIELAVRQLVDLEGKARVGRTVSDLTVEVLAQVQALQAGEAQPGLLSGFPGLDRLVGGFLLGSLVVVAARPGMGKTALAMNIATNVAAGDADGATCVFSLEMTAEELGFRLLSSLSEVGRTEMTSKGALSDEDWSRLTDAAQGLKEMPLHIDDTPGLTTTEIHARALAMAGNRKVRLVVIDYLQLLASEAKGENRNIEVGALTASLKAIAKTLGCPILLVSQLNRAPEGRTDKRPILSDLRDSGSIEQDADVVLSVYREEMYRRDAEQGKAEVSVIKNRHGPGGGTCTLLFDASLTRFRETNPYA